MPQPLGVGISMNIVSMLLHVGDKVNLLLWRPHICHLESPGFINNLAFEDLTFAFLTQFKPSTQREHTGHS